MNPRPPRSHGPLTPLADAQAAVRARSSPLPAERVSLAAGAGRLLAAPVHAARDLPQSDVSMMDGYALRAEDAAAPLRVVLEIAAGDPPALRALQAGEAARIFTGAPLPPGADCVVMQEQTRREGDTVRLDPGQPTRPGQHVRRRGEEVSAGALVLPEGTLLGPAELSLAAGCGAALVQVRQRPRVAILTTGDELVPLGGDPPAGKLIETNSLALAQLCREAGAEPVLLGIAGDAVETIASRLIDADADILVTTGGASVGDHDHAQAALERLGGALVFHSVGIRPGKPILFGVASPRPGSPRPRLVFGLPGNPAAAMLGFELFARLAVRLMLGDPRPERPAARAVLRGGPLAQVPGLVFFPRGRVTAEGEQLVFTPAGQQSSMQIGSWAGANAVARLAPGEDKVQPGEHLDVLLLGPL